MNTPGKALLLASVTAVALGLPHRANEVARSREAQVLALLGEQGKVEVLQWYNHTQTGSRGSGKHEIIGIETLPEGRIAVRFRDLRYEGMQGEANCKKDGSGVTCVII